MGRSRFSSNTVRTTGALLPSDVLAKIVDSDGLEGLTPDAYGHEGSRLRDLVNDAWNELKPLWWGLQRELKHLPETDLTATAATREKWLLPLLKTLGFDGLETQQRAIDVAGTGYPISHIYNHSPIHLMGARTELDTRIAGIPGAAKLSPHSLVQQFLNRSDDHLWGIVTNGNKLRLLRDSVSLTRQAFVEFDLAAMFNGEVYTDFNLLYRTIHATRFTGDRPEHALLEAWVRAAREDGTRARDQLSDGVQTAIETLGTGFLTHPNNEELRQSITKGHTTEADLYKYLLRLVYRLLFLFVAEDRDLLHPEGTSLETRDRYARYYSTARLRSLSTTPTATRHDDLWHSLKALMDVLAKDEGEPQLGLPGLGSFLWQQDTIGELRNTSLTNYHLLTAIHNLSHIQQDQTNRRIDYTQLGAEELGSVYESLLELEISADQATWAFSTGVGERHERKGTGSYYTPPGLVEHVLDWALDPAIETARQSAQPAEAILALKVLDPSCGSGHFLIAAAHRLGDALATARTGELHPPAKSTEQAVRDVIASCLYGVDINPLAVELCKIALWLDSLSRGTPLSFLDHRIREGNSLLGVTPILLDQGIPDEAYKPQDDDDNAVAKSWKAQNSRARAGQASMFTSSEDGLANLSALWEQVQLLPEGTLAEVQEKSAAAISAREFSARPRLAADSWCAAFLIEKTEQRAPIICSPDRSPTIADEDEIRAVTSGFSPFHWHLEFPEVFVGPMVNESTGWSGGFDVIVGNPPFLNQLELATAPSRKLATLFSARFPGVAKGYADIATVFLELASQLAKSDGGRIGLVQPDSLLAAADAKPARQAVTSRGGLETLWVAGTKVFDANVLVCVPVLINGSSKPEKLFRYKGANYEQLTPLIVDAKSVQRMETWAPLISEGFGIPRVDLNEDITLASYLKATADFRDQYYGLVPFTSDAAGRQPDGKTFAALVTTGLIDPAALLWGTRPTKFNKTKYDAPIVDLMRLRADSELGPWADRRLVPKLLLATQTKVLEVVVDAEGVLLPSVPVISIDVTGITLWHAAAALMSPPVTAWAAARYMGAAMSTHAVKLSASQVHSLPAPLVSEAWDSAASQVQLAHEADDGLTWRAALTAAAELMVEAYCADNVGELMAWWAGRLPAWRM